MKNLIYAFAIALVLVGCSKKETVYTPRVLTETETFNSSQEGDALHINKNGTDERVPEGAEIEDGYNVRFRDTIVTILVNPSDPKSATDKFSFAQYVNSQKTSVLVQVADSTTTPAPVYLINFAEDKVQVVALSRPSKGANDKEFTNGIVKTSKSGYLVNNDFFVTSVNAKVYLLKRQNPEERIQGKYFNLSRDKQTLVFLTQDALYQVHFATNEALNTPLGVDASMPREQVESYVASNYIWAAEKGISFLKKKGDKGSNDKVVDISSFK
jgi:hypothetical protein